MTDLRVGGMLVGYYALCPRKAWHRCAAQVLPLAARALGRHARGRAAVQRDAQLPGAQAYGGGDAHPRGRAPTGADGRGAEAVGGAVHAAAPDHAAEVLPGVRVRGAVLRVRCPIPSPRDFIAVRV